MTHYTIYHKETHKNDSNRLDVKIKFSDGRVYVVVFCNTKYIENQLGGLGCVAIPGLIALDVVSMQKVKQVIHHIVQSGYFEHLVPESDG